MSIEQRRFPRFRYSAPARVRGSQTSAETSDITVSIQTLSPRGIGVRMALSSRLQPGHPVELSFLLDGSPLTCDARVVWCAGGYAGLHLRPQSLSQREKEVFARWLVPRLRFEREAGMTS